MGLIGPSSGSADLEVLLITGHVMSLSPFDPLLPPVYPPKNGLYEGGPAIISYTSVFVMSTLGSVY